MKKVVIHLRKYQKQTINRTTFTDADSAGDVALLANTPAQAESLLHSLDQLTSGIGLHVNADEYGVHVS